MASLLTGSKQVLLFLFFFCSVAYRTKVHIAQSQSAAAFCPCLGGDVDDDDKILIN